MADGARNLTANFTASTTGFSRAITELKAQLSSLNTALAQNKQQIKDVNSSITANRREYNQLQQEVQRNGTATEEQRRRLEQLANEYTQLTTDLGALQTAQADLRNQIRQTNNQLTEQTNAAEQQSKALDKVKSAAQDAGKYFAGLGATAAAAFSSVLALTAKYAAAADDINTLAKTTGLSTEAVQKYQYATDLCDVSIETIADSLKQLKPKMQQARDGSEELRKSFADLGVEYQNTDGSLRDSSVVFEELILGLSKIENQTERDAAAVKLFGESAGRLNPILADGGKAFREVSEQMQQYILPQETLDRLNAFNDKLDTLKARGSGVMSQIAAELSDGFDPLFNTANSLLDKVQSAIDSGEIEQLATDVADCINDVAEALGKAVKFVIDFKDEIAAGAAALITFKAAISIGNLISATVAAVQAFSVATEGATAAQAAFNAVGAANPYVLIASVAIAAVSAIGMYCSQLDTASDVTRNHMRAVEDLTEITKKYADEANELDDIAEQYEIIAEAEGEDAEKKDELRILQEKLIDQFGDEAAGIDLVNGKYQDQITILQNLSEEKRKDAAEAAQQVLDELDAAEKAGYTIKSKGGLLNFEEQVTFNKWLADNPSVKQNIMGNIDMPWLGGVSVITNGLSDENSFTLKGGTFEENQKSLEQLQRSLLSAGLSGTDLYSQVTTLLSQIKQDIATRDKNKAIVDAVNNGTYSPDDGKTDGKTYDGAGTTTETVDATLLNRLKTAYGQGMMSTADYYNNALDIISNLYGTDSTEYESTKAARDAWAKPLEEDLKLLKRKKDRGEIDDKAYYSEFLRLSKELYGSGDNYEDAYTLKLQYDKKAAAEAEAAAKKQREADSKAWDEAYKAKKQNLQNQHDFELLSDEEYYNQAYQLAVQYYGATNQTAIDAEKELYKWKKKQAEEYRKEQLDGTKAAYSELFAAIDAETQKREREKEDAALAERERILNNRLAYEQLDEFSRAELDEELSKLQQEKNDLLYDRSVEDAKAAAEEVYELAQQAYEDASVDLNAAMSQATAIFSALGKGTKDIATAINNTTNTTTNNNQAVTVQVDAFNKTLDQLVDAFRKAISSDL